MRYRSCCLVISGALGWVVALCQVGDPWQVLLTLPPEPTPWRDIVHGGKTETVLERPGLTALHFIDERNAWAVGSAGLLLRSKDGGRTWREKRYQSPCYFKAVYFQSVASGWVAGRCGRQALLLRTRDGGRSWQRVQAFYKKTAAAFRDVWFLDAKRGWVTGWFEENETEQGVILSTEDGGAHWRIQYKDEVQGNFLEQTRFADARVGWSAGNYRVVHSTDGGRSWVEQLQPDEREKFVAVEVIGPSECWIAGRRLLHTTDGGKSWSRREFEFSRGMHTLTSIRFRDSNNGWISSSDGRIYRTADGGQSWYEEKPDTTYSISAIWLTRQNLFAATIPGAILRRHLVE